MASAAIDLDARFRAHLNAFLLSRYVAGFHDPRQSPADRLKLRMELESLLLEFGPTSLTEIQRSFNLAEERVRLAPAIAEWFITFVSSRNEDWLRNVNLSTVEFFWRALPAHAVRRGAVELIAKVESTLDPFGHSAFGSLLVGLFRESQPKAFEETRSPDGQLIIDFLVNQTELTSPLVLQTPQGRFANYCLRVLRFCFKDRFEVLTDSEVDFIIGLSGNITEAVRKRMLEMMLIH